MNFKLPKKNKLKSKKEILNVLNNRKYIAHDFIKLLYKKTDKPNYKVAFFVPKKYIKLATDRKKIKRLISENFRLTFPKIKLNLKNNYSIIILYQSGKIKKFKEIKNCIEVITKKFEERDIFE